MPHKRETGRRTLAVRLEELLEETRRLSRRLRRASGPRRSAGGPAAAGRDLLPTLEAGGPHTVPQMARARAVSRQHVQTLVNALLERGEVEMIENPAHARSHLVRLTARGRQLLAAMREADEARFREWGRGLSPRQLGQALAVLRSIRERIEAGPPPGPARRLRRGKSA